MNRKRLQTIAISVLLLAVSHGARAQSNITLPPPEKLVTMSIQQRLELMESIRALPANQQKANLDALRDEISSLSPKQKDEMTARFQSEFQALPKDEQDKLRAALAAAQTP